MIKIVTMIYFLLVPMKIQWILYNISLDAAVVVTGIYWTILYCKLVGRILRMLGTFNQHLPMIHSNNYWCQSKPTSFPSTNATCNIASNMQYAIVAIM